MKLEKPKFGKYLCIHEVTDYMNEKYGYKDKDWDELIDNYVDLIQGNGVLLTFNKEGDNELEHKVVDEFCDDDSEEVEIYYWW